MRRRIEFGILLAAVVVADCLSDQCRLPSSLWCSSVETARTCEVEEQCNSFVWSSAGNASDERVDLVLYYETLCPGCRTFIKDQLWPTYNQLDSIMNLTLVPFGNAVEVQVGSKWEFTCQHGFEECVGNLMQTCAIWCNNKTNEWFSFITCLEMSDEWPRESGPKCADRCKIDYSAIMQCMETIAGNELQHQMATETENAAISYVPWITLNGIHNERIQNLAMKDLTKLVCETYTGALKPPACQTTDFCVKN